MGSDDFIDLESSCPNNNNGDYDDDDKGSESRDAKTDSPSRLFSMKEDPLGTENVEVFTGNGERGDDPNVLDMDLEDDLVQRQTILYERVEIVGSPIMEQLKGEGEQNKETVRAATLNNSTSNNNVIDESPIAGVKRARMTYIEKQPSVRVIYNSLARESKRKLMGLMQQWSQWQAKHQLSSSESEDVPLEDGEETYFPALHVDSKKSSVVTFWVDKQARQDVDKDKVKFEADVPLYDREYTLGSTSVDGSSGPEGIEALGASRCFNCGSYSHSLRDCPKPRDNIAISNARKMHTSKRNPTAGNHAQVRYYQKAPGKFDNLQAGVLGAETRECLGIGEYDPPPWFHRMREMGYPPGYLDVDDEDQPSGITIYADEETKEEYEDGELPERSEPEPPQRKMTVKFPGINAPLLENADHHRWAAPSTGSGSNPVRNRVHHRLDHSSDHHGWNFQEQRWPSDLRVNGAPDTEHVFSSSYPGYSPRYSPYNYNPIPRSPDLGRSLSDRGWRSPLHYETSPAHSPHSPHPYPSATHSPKDHHWSHDHWSNKSSYGRIPDSASQKAQDRHDHRGSHHRR
ncbi:unnamed protein product [Musa acuminata subsp. burmannicoides]